MSELVRSDMTCQVKAIDEHGSGGAHHVYNISLFDPDSVLPQGGVGIVFQRGGVLTEGVNGITCEALLAIVAHRLDHFQKGPFACLENRVALDAVLVALESLDTRTKNRRRRGIEGIEVA